MSRYDLQISCSRCLIWIIVYRWIQLYCMDRLYRWFFWKRAPFIIGKLISKHKFCVRTGKDFTVGVNLGSRVSLFEVFREFFLKFLKFLHFFFLCGYCANRRRKRLVLNNSKWQWKETRFYDVLMCGRCACQRQKKCIELYF